MSTTKGRVRSETEDTPEKGRGDSHSSQSATETKSESTDLRNLFHSQSLQDHRKPLKSSTPIRCDLIDRKTHENQKAMSTTKGGVGSETEDTPEKGRGDSHSSRSATETKSESTDLRNLFHSQSLQDHRKPLKSSTPIRCDLIDRKTHENQKAMSTTKGGVGSETEDTPEKGRGDSHSSRSATETKSESTDLRNLFHSQSLQDHRKPLKSSTPIRCDLIDRKTHENQKAMSTTKGGVGSETEDTPEKGRGDSHSSRSATETKSESTDLRNLFHSQSLQDHRKPLKSSTPIRCDPIDRQTHENQKVTNKVSPAVKSYRESTFEHGNDSSSTCYDDKRYSFDSFSDISNYKSFVSNSPNDSTDISIMLEKCSIDDSSDLSSVSTSTSYARKNNLKVSNHNVQSSNSICDGSASNRSVAITGDSFIDFKNGPVSSFVFINRTLTQNEYETWKNTIKSWKTYEKKIGTESGSSFVYLLLDPTITQNLPDRADNLKSGDRIKIWNTFVRSIFYIGKGTVGHIKRSYYRPKTHLKEAFNKGENIKNDLKKEKIQSIWKAGKGVIIIQIFHHVETKDAFAREAAMIDAIGLKNLTNKICGQKMNTTIQNWNTSDIQKLGCYLLYRAMRVYLNDGERQLKCADKF